MSNKNKKILIACVGLIALAVSAFFLTRSSSKINLLSYIPGNSISIIKLNIPVLAGILGENQNEITTYSFLKDSELKEPLTKLFMNIIKQPELSGLDFTTDMYCFFEALPRGTAIGFLLKISNEDLFGKHVKNYVPAGKNYGVNKDISYAEFDNGIYISWNNSLALLTIQKTEGVDYFQKIISKSKPGADKNKIYSDLKESADLISCRVFIDEVFNNVSMSRNSVLENFKNPFPKQSSLAFQLNMDKDAIRSEFSVLSENSTELGNLNFFNSTGSFNKYSNHLFSTGNPYLAYSVSIVPSKFFEFMDKLSPGFKNGLGQNPLFSDIEELITGDIAIGLSIKDSALDENKLIPSNENLLDFIDPIVHIGTKTSARYSIEKMMGTPLRRTENGFQMGFGNYFIGILEKEIIVCQNEQNLKRILNGTFKTAYSESHKHVQSPLFIMSNSGSILKLASTFIFSFDLKLPVLELLLKSAGPQYGWIENSKLKSEMLLHHNQIHPLILVLRTIEEMYIQTQSQKDVRIESGKKNQTNNL